MFSKKWLNFITPVYNASFNVSTNAWINRLRSCFGKLTLGSFSQQSCITKWALLRLSELDIWIKGWMGIRDWCLSDLEFEVFNVSSRLSRRHRTRTEWVHSSIEKDCTHWPFKLNRADDNDDKVYSLIHKQRSVINNSVMYDLSYKSTHLSGEEPKMYGKSIWSYFGWVKALTHFGAVLA